MYFDRARGKEALFLSLFLIVIISLIHVWALKNYAYFLYWWLDVLMHLLGGFWISLNFLWLYFSAGLADRASADRNKVLWLSLAVFMAIAILWEIFELFVHHTLEDPNFVLDTLSDIVSGIVGALIAYRYFVFNFIKSNEQS